MEVNRPGAFRAQKGLARGYKGMQSQTATPPFLGLKPMPALRHGVSPQWYLLMKASYYVCGT